MFSPSANLAHPDYPAANKRHTDKLCIIPICNSLYALYSMLALEEVWHILEFPYSSKVSLPLSYQNNQLG